jgi:hypothetical protein
MRVWGCPSEVRIYNPREKKLVGIPLDMPNSLKVIDSIVHLTPLGLWSQEMHEGGMSEYFRVLNAVIEP